MVFTFLRYAITLLLMVSSFLASAQKLPVKPRSVNALSGSAFARSISDSSLSVDGREERIFQEIRSGNVPDFYRRLVLVTDTALIGGKLHTIKYYVLPDYLAIGSDEDYFYCPMRPALAQRIASLMKCSLPTRKIVDRIYQQAALKLVPQPIPPGNAMITVPVFINHSRQVTEQRQGSLKVFPLGSLVAGNKKDIVLSNKIFTEDGKSHVVIYGWHQQDGRAIQPLYNGHNADWVDYSHGVRLIQSKVRVNGKKNSISNVLQSKDLHVLLSDEGAIARAYYPLQY